MTATHDRSPARAGRIEGRFTMVETQLADGPLVPRGRRAGARHAPNGSTRIGKGVVIEGEVKGGEDLVIDGKVDGTIDLSQHVLTVGSTGSVKADLSAKPVVVLGKVSGIIQASERVSIGETGSVEGAISAPRLVVAVAARLQSQVNV